MKIAYVAGPYRAKTKIGIIINIIKARKASKELWKMGYVAVCPHSNSGLFDGIVTDEVFLDGCIEILKRCDLIVLLPKWKESSGTINEYVTAKKEYIPCYFWGDGSDMESLKKLSKISNT